MFSDGALACTLIDTYGSLNPPLDSSYARSTGATLSVPSLLQQALLHTGQVEQLQSICLPRPRVRSGVLTPIHRDHQSPWPMQTSRQRRSVLRFVHRESTVALWKAGGVAAPSGSCECASAAPSCPAHNSHSTYRIPNFAPASATP
jgi:hypothetical protein